MCTFSPELNKITLTILLAEAILLACGTLDVDSGALCKGEANLVEFWIRLQDAGVLVSFICNKARKNVCLSFESTIFQSCKAVS